MGIFEPIPFNNIFKDRVYDGISPQNDTTVIDLNDCYFHANLKIHYNNADMHVHSRFNILPWPLQLWWSQMSIEIEGVPLEMADMHNIYTNYLKTLTRDSIYENINFGILDTAAANLGWRKRLALFSGSQDRLLIEKVNMPLFSDGNSYIPSVHDFKIK